MYVCESDITISHGVVRALVCVCCVSACARAISARARVCVYGEKKKKRNKTKQPLTLSVQSDGRRVGARWRWVAGDGEDRKCTRRAISGNVFSAV